MNADLRPDSILLVEDDHDIRETIGQVLEEEGYPVILAANGKEALELLRHSQVLPRVILLDMMMPVLDGRQFHAAQQADPRLAGIPVVVLSADGNTRDKAKEIGAIGYLRKPLHIDALLDVLSGLAFLGGADQQGRA